MWYLEIFNLLISNIKVEEQDKAHKFLIVLFTQIEVIAGKDSIAPPVLLGLIDKMYRYYGLCDTGSVELIDFARDLFTLTLTHMKKCYDENVFLLDYPLIFENPDMLAILGYPDFQWTSLRKELYTLEIKTLEELNYNFEPNLEHIEKIIDLQPIDTIKSFLQYLQPFINKNSRFNQFSENIALLCLNNADQTFFVENIEVKELPLPKSLPISNAIPFNLAPPKQKVFHTEMPSSGALLISQFKVMSPCAFFAPNLPETKIPKFLTEKRKEKECEESKAKSEASSDTPQNLFP